MNKDLIRRVAEAVEREIPRSMGAFVLLVSDEGDHIKQISGSVGMDPDDALAALARHLLDRAPPDWIREIFVSRVPPPD